MEMAGTPKRTVSALKKEKAQWNAESNKYVCELMAAEVTQGNQKGAGLNLEAYARVGSALEAKFCNKYDKRVLKNKWDNMKRDYAIWKSLLHKETGIRWNIYDGTIDASDEWWERKIKDNYKARRFRNQGLPNAHLMDTMFDNVPATPIMREMSPAENDVNSGGNEEGTADSHDSNFDTPLGKRRFGGNEVVMRHDPSTPWERGKKNKSGKKEERSAIEKITSVMQSYSDLDSKIIGTPVVTPKTHADVVFLLQKTPAIRPLSPLWFFTLELMRDKIHKDYWTSMPDAEMRLAYAEHYYEKSND